MWPIGISLVYGYFMELPVAEAARHLGLSTRTIRRKLHDGELSGRQLSTPQGFVWMVELADEQGSSDGEVGALRELVDVLKDEVSTLKGELTERGQEMQQLHVLLQQAQAALPVPKENRHSWWRFW